MAYSSHDKAIVAAAVERYGEAAGLTVLRSAFGLRPSRATVHARVREQGIIPTEDARAEIAQLDRLRKATWQASIDAERDATFEAFDAACEARNYLGMQQSATAIGILYDKLVPPTKAGFSVNASGDGVAVTIVPGGRDPMMLFGPQESAEVVEGEARELPVAPRADDDQHRPVIEGSTRAPAE